MTQFPSNPTSKWSTLILGVIFLTLISCNGTREKASTEKPVKAPSSTIHEAAFFGDFNAVKDHIAFKTDLNQKDAYGSTPLHIAATFGKPEVAKLLIEGGADLGATSADGSTPLHTAAFFCRTEIVKSLLANGADVSIRNAYGSTALESISSSFSDVKPIYEQLSKDLGPLGLKLNFKELEETRPIVAEMIIASSK